jgi:hypothetical protein
MDQRFERSEAFERLEPFLNNRGIDPFHPTLSWRDQGSMSFSAKITKP